MEHSAPNSSKSTIYSTKSYQLMECEDMFSPKLIPSINIPDWKKTLMQQRKIWSENQDREILRRKERFRKKQKIILEMARLAPIPSNATKQNSSSSSASLDSKKGNTSLDRNACFVSTYMYYVYGNIKYMYINLKTLVAVT